MPKVGDLRWNSLKGFYQGYAIVPSPIGPVPAWVKAPNQEQAQAAMGAGYSNLEAFKKAARSGAAGAAAPHTQMGPTGPEMAGALVASGKGLEMGGPCLCSPTEHSYEPDTLQETGLRPLYRASLTLAPATAGVLNIEANDAGPVNRLALFASDLATGGGMERQITIPRASLLNSKPFDFGTLPNGTLVPWAQIDPDGIGRNIGLLELVKTDQFTVPVFNDDAAVTATIEGFAYLVGNCPSHYLRR
jgi:hypothetical protein